MWSVCLCKTDIVPHAAIGGCVNGSHHPLRRGWCSRGQASGGVGVEGQRQLPGLGEIGGRLGQPAFELRDLGGQLGDAVARVLRSAHSRVVQPSQARTTTIAPSAVTPRCSRLPSQWDRRAGGSRACPPPCRTVRRPLRQSAALTAQPGPAPPQLPFDHVPPPQRGPDPHGWIPIQNRSSHVHTQRPCSGRDEPDSR